MWYEKPADVRDEMRHGALEIAVPSYYWPKKADQPAGTKPSLPTVMKPAVTLPSAVLNPRTTTWAPIASAVLSATAKVVSGVGLTVTYCWPPL